MNFRRNWFFGLVLAFVASSVLAQSVGNPTREEMVTVLNNVWVLYALMLLGTLGSMLKQVGVAKQEGSTASVADHVLRLKEGAYVWIANTLAFAALIYGDQLNFASAVGIGFALNELVDLDPTSSRSNMKKE